MTVSLDDLFTSTPSLLISTEVPSKKLNIKLLPPSWPELLSKSREKYWKYSPASRSSFSCFGEARPLTFLWICWRSAMNSSILKMKKCIQLSNIFHKNYSSQLLRCTLYLSAVTDLFPETNSINTAYIGWNTWLLIIKSICRLPLTNTLLSSFKAANFLSKSSSSMPGCQQGKLINKEM